VASFTIAPKPATVGQNVTFDASASTPSTGGTIISYAWTFTGPSGAAGNPGGVTTSQPFSEAGTHTATLKITDDQNCSNELTQTFEVQPAGCDAVAAFTATANLLAVTFDTTGSAGTLSFDYGDGTPAGTATSHTYAADGTYNVTLTATGTGGCTDTATQSVTVAGGGCDAVATLSIVSTNNLMVTLDTPNSVGTIMFDYGDGTSGAGYVHTYTAAGTYTITVTATGAAGCEVKTSKIVTVSEGGVTPDGDGDCNDVVDIYDALLAAIIDAGNPDNVAVCDADMLDVDQNGVVDINDALAIAKYDVGLTCGCVLDPKK
jgi:PKD repeat protein